MKKKLLSLLLVLALLLQLSGGALAAIGDFADNTPAQNEALYNQLAALTGGTSEEARALLDRLGLLDKDGNLDLTASITLDGKSMTVDGVRRLLAEPGTDLTKIADVDGMPLTLGDLQTILNIEAELARIQETYFSGKTFGADATDNLNSLMSQIETQGIGVNGEGRAADNEPYLEFSSDDIYIPVGGTPKLTLTLKNGPLSKAGTFWIAFSANDMIECNGAGLKVTIPAGEKGWQQEIELSAKYQFLHDIPAANNDFMAFMSFVDAENISFTSQHTPSHIVFVHAKRAAQYFSWKPVTKGIFSNFQPTNDDGNRPLTDAEYSLYRKGTVISQSGEPDRLAIPLLPESDTDTLKTGADEAASLGLAMGGQDLKARGIQLEASAEVGITNFMSGENAADGWDRRGCLFAMNGDNYGRSFDLSGKPPIDPMRHLNLLAQPMLYARGDTAIPTETYTVAYEDAAPAAGQTPKTSLAVGDKVCFPIQMTCCVVKGTYPNNIYHHDVAPPYRPSGPQSDDPPHWDVLGPIDKTMENNSFWTTISLKTAKQENTSLFLYTFKERPLTLTVPLDTKANAYFENDHMPGFGQTATWSSGKQYTYAQVRDAVGFTGTKNNLHFYVRESSVQVIDQQAPKVVSVTAPMRGTYVTGQFVPIEVTFDEPVKCKGLSITPLNGGGALPCLCNHAEAQDGISAGTSHVFRYKVPKVDGTTLRINQIGGVQDVFGNFMVVDTESREVDHITLETTLMRNAVTGVTATKASLKPTEAAEGTALTLALDADLAYQTKYADYDKTPANAAPFVARLQGSEALIPFALTEAGGQITGATAPTGELAFDTTTKTYIYDILAYERDSGGTWGNTPVSTGKSVTITVEPMVFANVDKVTYPTGDRAELSLTDPYVPKLGVSFINDPTFKTGTWESSDEEIATIATVEGNVKGEGQVTLVGQKLGPVTFTFTANDGALPGKTDPDGTHKKTAISQAYNVTAGGEAGIVVPKGGDTIIALENSKAQVRWYGNMKQYLVPVDATHVNYTVEVFKGNITAEAGFTGKTPVHTSELLPMEKNSYEIPEHILTELSIADPAYTVRISAPHPNATAAAHDIRLYAYAHIIVNPVPVAVKLTQPTSLYALDSAGAATVGWTIENYSTVPGAGTTAKLTVERVPETGAPTKIVDGKVIPAGGTQLFTPEPITGESALRDLYVVTITAKNESDTVWNSDSYQFYVYKNGALDIVVGEDKRPDNSVTLSNRENDLVKDLPTDTDKIMELRGKLGLNTPIGINYDDYAWSALKDGIAWKSEDDTKVGLNFKQGSFYEDIKRFNYESYLPATTMAISGTAETEKTVITATHANTGMSTSIDVKVESLENRLYLFQTTPMLKTTLTYTDGKGAKKTAETNEKGTLALYEPDGIKGAVYFRGVDAKDDNALYLGTIFPGNLRSGEGNTLVRELYPINSFTLRKVARTDLFLKNPDGTPYVGTVTVRGGVYKNDSYCQDARLGVNNFDLKDGTKPQTASTNAEGKLTIQMDSTQFWSAAKGETAKTELQADDKLEYIFELTGITTGGLHYPALVYVDGVSPVALGSRTGEGVFTLETATAPGIFLAHQETADRNGDRHNVRNRAAYAGPNETTPKGTDLQSTMLLWGETELATKDYSVQLLDEFGFQPPAQKSQTITYPFSSIPVVRNTTALTPETLTDSGWVPEGQPRGIKLQVLKKGTLQKDIPTDIKVVDLSKVPPLKGETATNIMVDLTKGSGVGAPPEMNHKNKVVDGLMKRLSGGDESISGPVNTSNFKMIISPGDDSATFKAFIWAGHNSLGLEDAEYNDDGLSVTPHLLEDELSTGFGGGDAAALASGAQAAAQTGADLAKSGKSVSGGGSFGGQLEGYYECLIKFNFKTQKWEIFTLGGGFTVGFGGSFGKTVNQMVGPIPITASFELGAAIQLDFKMASRYKVMGKGLEWSDEYKDKQYVSDFLTTLRINAYFEAFGGIGFDISIVALKFGVFGRLGVDNSNAFLSRTYLANKDLHQVNGQALKLTGEVGIEFVLTVIGIIDYQATLASIEMAWTKYFNNWEGIQDYWKNTGSGLSLGGLAAFGARNGLTLVDASASLQSRDYLEDFDRTWGAPRRMSRMLDPTNGLLALQSNAYPNSRPYVTDDGKYLLYTSDQDSSELTSARVYASEKKNDGTYPEGAVITAPTDFPGFGDSDLRLAGKDGLAVAAWVRQNTDHQLKAGDPVTPNTQSVLTNATEIVASVNTGSGWTSTRLTENGSPDLAPVVAANGSKAIVAWRSVYAADAEKPMDFTAQDKVLYKIYDGAWGETKTLYPGTSGVVKGIEAAMLPDGTAAVTYVLDRSGIGTASTYEVAATIVGTDGNPGRTLMLTSDNYSDENPQIAAVDCGTAPDVDQRFIIGWYSTKGEGGDIRMAALDANGLPSASFPESLGQIAKETMIGNNFRFVAASKLEDLSILWSVTSQDQAAKGDQLLGVKFLPEGGKIGLSAPIDIATLPAHNNTDHFDAYVSNAADNQIKAVIQGTEYAAVVENDPSTYHSYEVACEDDKGVKSKQIVKTPKGQTMLYTATESYKNKLTLTQVWADYANLAVNSLLPVQFTVQNSGFETLTSVSIKLGSGAAQNFEVNLAPNESATLTLYHAVGGTVADVDYSITPTFASGALAPTAGKLHLDYPDVGVAGLKVIAENEGKRDLRITLYNGGAAKIKKDNRSIHIEFYDDSLMEGTPVNVTYGGYSVSKIIISGDDKLALADNGALCVDLSFDLDGYLTAKSLKENEEIPATGMRLYAKVWVEDSTIVGEDKTLPEFHKGNNTASVQLDSLLHRAGEPVTITVAQSLTEAGKTKADITVRNNSLKSVDGSGNVIATLLDKNGNVLETMQSYKPESKGRTAAPNGLLTLAGEESAAVDFTFSQPGASVKVTYGALVLDDDTNAALTSLSATGIPVRLADFEVDPKDATKFTAKISTAAGKTLVTALTQDPRATVTVNGAAMPQGGTPLALSSGENKITIVITAKDGTTKRTYEILAERTTSDPDADPITYPITATAGPGGSIAPKGTSRVARSSSKTYTITPDKGYAIADVLVDGVSAGKVSAYTFAKVKEKHSIEARFAPIALAFTDVAQTDWFYSAVEFVAQKNLMKGVGKNLFAPLGTSSRATVATVLYRMAGSPAVTGAPGFGDVPAGKWHSDAITWAAANGIAQGNGKEFAPNDDVSREQLAQLFYNYAKLKKYDLTPAGDLSKFTDAPTGWSREAVAWAVGSGILAGRGKGILDPTGKATRAELATMLMRLQALEK